MRWLLLIFIAVVACGAVSVPLIFMGSSNDDVIDVSHVQVPVPIELVGTPVLVPALTHEASERRRVAAEHASLLTSIPPTVPVSPTFTLEELQRASYASVDPGLVADGIPAPTPVEAWFDSKEGLTFYRDSGGDWTPRAVRESNPYARFIYYDDYPQDIPSFASGTVHEEIARNLAFGASDVLPFLGPPTPQVIRTFLRGLGWELRPGESPYINVWTKFTFIVEGAAHVYAVGGVMRLDLVSRASDSGESIDYLVPGPFVGPVVAERLGIHGGE